MSRRIFGAPHVSATRSAHRAEPDRSTPCGDTVSHANREREFLAVLSPRSRPGTLFRDRKGAGVTKPVAATGEDGRHLYTCPLCEAMCGLEIEVSDGKV